nr:hypothetical protein [Gluconobacter sp. Dm-74]
MRLHDPGGWPFMECGEEMAFPLIFKRTVINRWSRSGHDAVMRFGPFFAHPFQRPFAGKSDDLAGPSFSSGAGFVLFQRDEMDMGIARSVVMDGGDPGGSAMCDFFCKVANETLVKLRRSFARKSDNEAFGNSAVLACHRFMAFGQGTKVGRDIGRQAMTFSEQDELLAITTDVAQSCGCFANPVSGGDAAML